MRRRGRPDAGRPRVIRTVVEVAGHTRFKGYPKSAPGRRSLPRPSGVRRPSSFMSLKVPHPCSRFPAKSLPPGARVEKPERLEDIRIGLLVSRKCDLLFFAGRGSDASSNGVRSRKKADRLQADKKAVLPGQEC